MDHLLHSEQVQAIGQSSSWVLDRFILFCKRIGLAIEGREMELLSFLASLESIRAKDNHFVDEMGRVQEERGRSLIDGDLC